MDQGAAASAAARRHNIPKRPHGMPLGAHDGIWKHCGQVPRRNEIAAVGIAAKHERDEMGAI